MLFTIQILKWNFSVSLAFSWKLRILCSVAISLKYYSKIVSNFEVVILEENIVLTFMNM